MKNFSAKNAEFETLKINNEAAITSANIGTDPNKIPLNKDLGSLAYQDAVNLDDVSADMLELRAIAAEISDSAVDVFVYDTSRDSDGGAWRKRTQHTSWYNEELNTATRGARREFPAVAVIVAEANKVTIYDGDDPDLGMWMVFEQISWGSIIFSCVTFINGKLVIGSGSGYTDICFIKERMSKIHPAAEYTGDYIWNELLYNPPVVVERPGLGIVHNAINDVAMTILPNAPIDDDTGLPVPTIAVATDGGVSVIKDDGMVVNKATTSAAVYQVKWMSPNRLVATAPAYYSVFDNPFVEESAAFLSYISDNVYNSNPANNHLYQVPNIISSLNNDTQILAIDSRTIIASTAAGLNVHEMGEGPAENNNHGIAAYITSKYNTGWMPGDIKLGTLSDTTVENIGVNSDELLTGDNGSFTNGVGDWVDVSIGSGSVVHNTGGGYVELARTDANNNARIGIGLNLQADQMYVLKFNLVDNSSSGVQVRGFKSSDNSFSANQIINFTANQDGLYTVSFRAEDGYDGILFMPISVTNTAANLDNVSIRATTELITNGDFSTDVSASDGIGWEYANNGTSSYSVGGGVLTLSHITYTNSMLYQTLDLVVGKQYVLTAQTGGTNYDVCNVRIGSSLGGNQFGNIVSNEALSSDLIDHVITFTPTQSKTYISLRINSSFADLSCVFDNISVRPAEEDRSVNNNGLQVIGEIDKTPVAPGADLVAYSGFSANNYLVQPYNEDLNFGTGDFSFTYWINSPVLNFDQAIFCQGDYSVNNDRGIYSWVLNSSGSLNSLMVGVGTDTITVQGHEDAGWIQIFAVRRNNMLSVYKNGVLQDSPISSMQDINYSNKENNTLILGAMYSSNTDRVSYAYEGSIALFKISSTAPTDAQIAKIYRDEKALFQDGAQSTLYGTSDSVTALAYDDSEQLLHVGTASGRSDFRGLARVNNTTTAISNSISAAEGTIIQN